jgi:hypothetical protein
VLLAVAAVTSSSLSGCGSSRAGTEVLEARRVRQVRPKSTSVVRVEFRAPRERLNTRHIRNVFDERELRRRTEAIPQRVGIPSTNAALRLPNACKGFGENQNSDAIRRTEA